MWKPQNNKSVIMNCVSQHQNATVSSMSFKNCYVLSIEFWFCDSNEIQFKGETISSKLSILNILKPRKKHQSEFEHSLILI